MNRSELYFTLSNGLPFYWSEYAYVYRIKDCHVRVATTVDADFTEFEVDESDDEIIINASNKINCIYVYGIDGTFGVYPIDCVLSIKSQFIPDTSEPEVNRVILTIVLGDAMRQKIICSKENASKFLEQMRKYFESEHLRAQFVKHNKIGF